MKERPILFSGPMVRAILEGRKTQTRRVVKPMPPKEMTGNGRFVRWVGDPNGLRYVNTFIQGDWWLTCPYGSPGDRLWVRETWAHYHTINERCKLSGASFPEISDGLAGYKADGFETIEEFKTHIGLMSESDFIDVEVRSDRWRPSIHMPRWASRITLEIVSVRVERLQDISEEDAQAEGVPNTCQVPFDEYDEPPSVSVGFNDPCGFSRDNFRTLWDDINGPDLWESNPWVWVVEFKRVEGGSQ